MVINPISKIRSKGKSLLILEDDYISIDIETTGFNPTYDDVIERGAIKVRNGIESQRWQSLIRPSQKF